MKNLTNRKNLLIKEIKVAKARLKGLQKFGDRDREIYAALIQLTNLYSELFEIVSKSFTTKYERYVVFTERFPEGTVMTRKEYVETIQAMTNAEFIMHQAVRCS